MRHPYKHYNFSNPIINQYALSINRKAAMNNNKLQERRGSLHSGRWTNEEELYAETIIDEFNAGTIDIPKGLSLRSYLARELQCSPKRYEKDGISFLAAIVPQNESF